MRITITPLAGDPITVRSTAGDQVAWEKYARDRGLPLQVKVTRGAGGGPVVDIERFPLHTWHAFLAHRALFRGQDDRPTLDAWLDTVDSVEPDKDEEDDDPDLVPTLAAL